MKRLSLWLLFFAVLGIQSALAQTYKVKGNVVSKSDNEPLIGVSILQKGTTNGVVTDIDGNYELQIQGGETTLVFSYIGLQTQELKVNARTGVLNVAMEDDSHLMDDVVVVAYGVRKKGTIAGSVSTVKNDKLENVPAPSFDQALQGQTTGLSVISNSGEPSKAATFQIRGTNSINSGTAPLFILDGVPISSSDFNTISPSDIESISVLKDASSTSIYYLWCTCRKRCGCNHYQAWSVDGQGQGDFPCTIWFLSAGTEQLEHDEHCRTYPVRKGNRNRYGKGLRRALAYGHKLAGHGVQRPCTAAEL